MDCAAARALVHRCVCSLVLRFSSSLRPPRSRKAQEIAESILQVGLQTPILVRKDGERFVLIEGLHRLEACKQLGEETILGYLVQARRH